MGSASSVGAEATEQGHHHPAKTRTSFLGILPTASTDEKSKSNGSNGKSASNAPKNSMRLSTASKRIASKNCIDEEKSMYCSVRAPAMKKSEVKMPKKEKFQDSLFWKGWYSTDNTDELYVELKKIGEKNQPKNTADAVKNKTKYPLWSKYYGYARKKDNARALDRWGSYHESWVRVDEPPEILRKCCEKLRKDFNLSENGVNSILVNYYYDGENTYIPAHRDTTNSLEDGSQIFCLSLGCSRDFILCPNEDVGKYEKNDITQIKAWQVNHGDLFALGQKTNDDYCHVVPKDPTVKNLRISIIFRSVSKSFINLDATPKKAIYANGKEKIFKAECITTKDCDDEGTKEHIADLINLREIAKKELLQNNGENTLISRQSFSLTSSKNPKIGAQLEILQEMVQESTSLKHNLSQKQIKNYYMGYGSTVLREDALMLPLLDDQNVQIGSEFQSLIAGFVNDVTSIAVDKVNSLQNQE